jgi:hypothetical protein
VNLFGPVFDRLSPRYQTFLIEYVGLGCSHRAEAAKRAGFAGNPNTLRTEAYRVLQDVDIKACLTHFQSAAIMPLTEAIHRMSEMSRADLTEILEPMRDDAGQIMLDKFGCPILTPREGLGWLVRSVTSERGQLKYEAHDAKDALKTVLKYHGALDQVLKIKELPSDPKELALLLAREVERTTGLRVESAATKKEGN